MPMKYQVTEKFTFEAAHYITGDKEEYSNIHGHSHIVYVTVTGKMQPPQGWIIEQTQFRKIVNSEISKLDHTLLNNKVEFTTAEGIAKHLFWKLRTEFPQGVKLKKIEICKTTTRATVEV